MGSFSWLRAECTTKRSNLTYGDSYKILIPKEFGGGFIKDKYYDYGYVFHDTDHEADLYGILAYWNHCDGMIYDCDHYPETMEEAENEVCESDETQSPVPMQHSRRTNSMDGRYPERVLRKCKRKCSELFAEPKSTANAK